MRRGAIYARYSTDLQNERSVEDQIALCRGYAARERIEVVATFHDRARSGGTMFERDGLLAFLAAAQSDPKPFDVIVVEALDRLSRDMEDLAGIHKKLSFHGVELAAVHDGVANTVLIGLRGLVGQLYREDGVKKVRRGMAGVVRQGRVAGSLGYGYRTVPGKPGERAIVEDEAAIVRRIFAEYLAGRSPRAIAGDLNRERVPAPRGRLWNASTINGEVGRGLGILHNEAYVGRIVWNRTRKVRNPYTGRRLARVNEAAEREISEAPQLRIVDDASWAAVHESKARNARKRPESQRRAVHLLSGLLKCGCCGSGISVKDRDRFGKVRLRCTAVGESGSCDNRRVYYMRAIERLAVDGLREKLRDPRLIEEYVRAYNAERRRLASAALCDRSRTEARLTAARREYDRLFNGYVKGFVSEAEAEVQLPIARADRDRLEAELASIEDEPNVVTLHPGLIADYLRKVDELAATLAGFAADGAAPAAALVARLRALVASVVVMPQRTGEPLEIEVRGRLAELLGPEAFPTNRLVGGNVGAG